MIVIKLMGGLGNQLFQYAFVKARSKENKVDFKLDINTFNWTETRRFTLDKFNIDYKGLCWRRLFVPDRQN